MQQPPPFERPAAGTPPPDNPRAHATTAILLAAPLLLWPALYNGYPLVFADTGTYLSQAIERYLGWDRPVFYSLLLLPLHLTLTTWPVIAAQALLAAHTLHLLRRVLLPQVSPFWLIPLLAFAAAATALPWFTAQLMPDLFTPLLALTLALLLFGADRVTRAERVWLTGAAAWMTATQQSSLPLALLLPAALLPLRRLAAAPPPQARDIAGIAAPAALAMLALLSVNFAARGRVALAPYGNVFLLARIIDDGPGRRVLQQDCPHAGWRLCAWRDRLPPSADALLWRADSPIILAGGHRAVSHEAGAIIAAALRREPGAEAAAFLHNTTRQLGMFATGDGLHAWPHTVDRWIARDFPAFEYAAYRAARQTRNQLELPAWMQRLHAAAALAGIAGCIVLLCAGLRRPHRAAGFAAAALCALLVNAAVAGGLSGPHHRYQSRVMLLPPLVAVLGLAALRRERGPPR